jgi:aspartyl/glutamyl-tRNA(Asn/Gln) amidotransferase C subunit
MITNEKLKEIAHLVKLYVTDEEIGSLAAELREYLKLFNTLTENEAEDISTIPAVPIDSLREDTRLSSLSPEVITGNSKHREDGFFAVEVKKHE